MDTGSDLLDINSIIGGLLAAGGTIGVVSSWLCNVVWLLYRRARPGQGDPPANVKRAVSWLVPFVIVLGLYAVGVWLGQIVYTRASLFILLNTTAIAISGKQLWFIVWEAYQESFGDRAPVEQLDRPDEQGTPTPAVAFGRGLPEADTTTEDAAAVVSDPGSPRRTRSMRSETRSTPKLLPDGGIECPQCASPNVAGARVCFECGESLTTEGGAGLV